jgi:hypothetical protein
MHGCAQCAVILALNTNNSGELSIHMCAQCAVVLILNTNNRGEPHAWMCSMSCDVDPDHK